MLAHVGANLRRLRRRAGLSQASLADASGLSRRMIVNLESGDTNVSLASLDRLAEALGASFVEVVSDPTAEPRRVEAVAWRGQSADSHAVLLGSVPARAEAQLWHWSLGPGERYVAEPDPEGWSEMVFVTQGCLRIELAEGERLVQANDFAIYSSSQPYAYVNAVDTVTQFVRNVVC